MSTIFFLIIYLKSMLPKTFLLSNWPFRIFKIKWVNPNSPTFFCFVNIFLLQALHATVFLIELNSTWNQTPCGQMKSSCNWNNVYQFWRINIYLYLLLEYALSYPLSKLSILCEEVLEITMLLVFYPIPYPSNVARLIFLMTLTIALHLRSIKTRCYQGLPKNHNT